MGKSSKKHTVGFSRARLGIDIHHILGLYSVDQNAAMRSLLILKEAGRYRPAVCLGRKHGYCQATAVLTAFYLFGHQISGSLFFLNLEVIHPSPRQTTQSPVWPLYPAPSPGTQNRRNFFIRSTCWFLVAQ